ncbi:MAG: carboxylesterase family protein [Treponema sp.]|nr:carboxylesterase family protein [Treponema sp.]
MFRITNTEQGLVEGLPAADPRITVFKGIPFAAPPVGILRWAPPQEPAKWDGVRQCFKYLAAPVQPGPEENPREDDVYAKEWSVDTSLQLNEDCLYLNIWTPAKKTDEKLPVYFWIYGGGWQVGHASEMEFDGERIARRGIVVVTINYRVNLFGFTCHPEITAEHPEAPANFGLLDQHKALTWVYKNISNFGGDPEQITIGGQSAGGGSVINQLAYKKNKPMIKRAVVESGMFINPFMTMFPSRSLADAEKIGQEFFEFCGVKNLKEARELSTEFLFKKWDEWGGFPKSAMTWGPVNDGSFICFNFFDAVEKGLIEVPPLLTGYTPDEFNFGPIGADKSEEINTVELALRKLTNSLEKNGNKNKNFLYRFDVPIPGWDNPGRFHSVDLWFFFETLAKCWRPFKGFHYDVSRQMCNYLCNFIKTGDVNGLDSYNCFACSKESDWETLPKWEPFSTSKNNFMIFEKGCHQEEFPASEKIKKYL